MWSVIIVRYAETAEQIKMSFQLRIRVCRRDHLLDGSSGRLMGKGSFQGEGAAHCKVWDSLQ